uniref:Cytochrome c oxidase subunit I n=1 Tax=Hymenolepis diminuta TaxID=6216 RepID=A0A0R3SI24_HYMDI
LMEPSHILGLPTLGMLIPLMFLEPRVSRIVP